jgi:hypothetical protein
MFDEVFREMRADAEDAEDVSGTSVSSSFEPIRRASPINPYVEIGKSLQNLRKTVYDMARKDAEHEVHLPALPAFRRSPPGPHHNEFLNHSSHATTLNYNQHDTSYRTPGVHIDEHSSSAGHARFTPPHDLQYGGLHHHNDRSSAQNMQSKGRFSTPYHRQPRGYEAYDGVPHMSARDLQDSEADEAEAPGGSHHRSSKTGNSGNAKKRRNRHREKASDAAESAGAAITPLHSATASPTAQSEVSGSSGSSAESSPAGESAAPLHAAVEVSQSIAVIVGQHEERFIK